LSNLWNIDPHEFFTTSFGSFMLLAPVIGMGFVRPDFNVNRPSELDFDALLASLANDDVTTAWLSPASARSILASAHDRHLALNLVMLAGAPIAPSLVTAIRTVTNADVRAPYGMTECLPVTDGANPLDTAALGGTSSGRPLAGCEVRIAPLDEPYADAPPGSWGEILVSAPWMFDSYDARWSADHATMIVRDGRRFHRTGDVGYLANGLLFQLGRTQHVLHTAKGPLASVALEENVASVTGRLVAAVPVGPSGLSVVALVLDSDCNLRLASDDVARSAREASRHSVAAVLEGRLPTDRRHQSKIDRTALAKSVEKFLAGS
jgi:acyl-CoA synthetase (AMP-forming)/AMP-acid ligase II